MEATDVAADPLALTKRRVNSLYFLWFLSPLGYPALHWIAPLLPEPVRIGIGLALFIILPGWLLHLLICPGVRIGLGSRITRAFALSMAVASLLGLLGWFFGGDVRLGEVPPPGAPPPHFLGRLSALVWGEGILLLVGSILLVTRRVRRATAFPPKQKGAGGSHPEPRTAGEAGKGSRAPESVRADGVGGRLDAASGERGGQGKGADPSLPEVRRGGADQPEADVAVTRGREAANPVMQRILRDAYRLGDQHKADHPIAPRWATLLVLGVMVLSAAILGYYARGSLGYGTDSLDHLSCIREMIEQDRILPRTTFYLDGDGAAVDARKGFFHVVLAALAAVTRIDPVGLWKLLPAFLIPLALVVFHTFARRLLRSEGTALFATFLALICFGEVTRGPFARLGYGSQMGTVLSWAALAVAMEFVLRGSRRAVLWILALTALAATATHLFASLLILFCLGVFFVALLLFRGPRYGGLRRLGLGLLAAAAGCLPVLLWRVLFTYAPLNPIHTHRHAILSFGENLFIMMPDQWIRLLTGAGLGGILLSFFLWKRAREDDAVIYMASLSIAPLLIVANPLVVPLLEPFLGYLIARFVLAVPFLMVLAYMARWMGENLLELNSPRRVVVSLFFYVFMVWLLFPRLEGFARSYSTANIESLRARSALLWEDLLRKVDEEIQVPAIVLSDPLTGYSIPAFTHHYTVSVLHQHGSPSDSLALERLAACRDVLSPYLGAGEKARLCRRFHVDYVLVNGLLKRRVDTFYCNVGPKLATVQKEGLNAEAGLFQKVWDLGTPGALYRVRKENLNALAGIVTPGQSRPFGRTTEELTRSILLHKLPDDTRPVVSDTVAGITLMAAVMDTTWAGRGERVGVTFYWRRVDTPPRFPVEVHAHLDTRAPRGRFWSMQLSKLHRKWRQERDGVVYRIPRIRAPLQGMFGIEHWPADRFIADRFDIYVPKRAAAGEYELKVKWLERSFLPNLPLGHFLSDRDAYDGPTVGWLEVY